MTFRRPTSPISFEALSPIPAEPLVEPSDSEDELDDTARAAKRRRIEQLGRAYLEGKPLFILTAGLKGPFEDGWVNPWSRSRVRQGAPRRSGILERRTVSAPLEIPDSASVTYALSPQPISSARNSYMASDSSHVSIQPSVRNSKRREPDHRSQRDLNVKKRKDNLGNLSRSPSRVDSVARSTSVSSLQYRSESYIKNTHNTWLKKDQTRLHPRVINPPRSPSPTPSSRPAVLDRSMRVSRKPADRTASSKANHGSQAHQPLSAVSSGFTAINVPRAPVPPNTYQDVPDPPTSPLSVSGTRLGNVGRQHQDVPVAKGNTPPGGRSRFSKPGAPASALTGRGRRGVNGDSQKWKRSSMNKNSHSASHTTQLSHCLPQLGKQQNKQIYMSLGDGFIAEPEALSHSPKQNSGRSHKQGHQSASANTDIEDHCEGSFIYHSATYRTTSYTFDQADRNSDGGGSTIPSAQIVPGNSKLAPPILSLYSTNPADTNNTIKNASQHQSSDDQLSTQAAVAIAQRSLQDDLATPVKAGIGLLAQKSGKHTGSQRRISIDHPINQPQPVNLYTTPTGGAATPLANDLHRNDFSTQAMINAMTPYALDTAKKEPARRRSIRDRSNESDVSASHDRGVLKQPHYDTLPPRLETKHSNMTEARSQNAPAPVSSNGHPPYVGSANTQQPHAENLSLPNSSTTALPFTLTTTSTNSTTRHQDGQGAADGLDDFDLSQAIADAGSFLQTWDIEKDLQQYSNANDNASPPTTSAGAPPLKSILRADAVQR
ncbi:hypothetical protein AJ80_04984 [Polytolypa hystricis UAMH7299]|uniref:Uncharacterized protein n=1 Tax=Polytolypa hystricis (strain UAMH7299) TaxID=1447883 RepID=A0A2B7Y7N1_POLH7|nr:hypothetical protein AJ80_04984 [Polytolypa hystricis UAMH7299]